ncbi:putative zinc-finger proteinc-like protein [Emericellopsis cladophorae]|uniref:Zinc-finger proteinc-like protein n=1 Tax=Emericellopsis cladophorae TaxID=2686198 RepID=A0A9P9XZ92_9HYPO|nr:putative zinc-finger proteinc-like protein [Emericellopsis cladophorae]KAI6780376.1 putative zinc-finger proteinc-like protein [Emericellopsis cladophorae]
MAEARDEPPEPIANGAQENLEADATATQGAQPIEEKQDEEMEPLKLLCGVCETDTPKYKCPRCYLPYCSVACNKVHREVHAGEPITAPPPPKPAPTTEAADDSAVRGRKFRHPWQTLQHSEELQWLFSKYPRLPSQLLQIHAATQPPPVQKPKIPASLLRDLPPQDQSNGWDKDKGIERGKEALRRARKADGEDGEALREYSELVLHFMEEARERKGL